MDEFTTTKLNADQHLVLEQSLLRLPSELSRRNNKAVQKLFISERDFVLSNLQAAATSPPSAQSWDQKSASLDKMIDRMKKFRSRLEDVRKQEQVLQKQSRQRAHHLGQLYSIPSLADVKYDEWSRIRLNRLLVDYLIRMGYADSAESLAKEVGIEDLVDLDAFVLCHKIAECLRAGSTLEALAWCAEHKGLKKMASAVILNTQNNLEFELRLQQYIEYRREGRLLEARRHAQEHLAPHIETSPEEVYQAMGLLAYSSNTPIEPYKTMYSRRRWDHLANLFIKTHHELFSLPAYPLLYTTLSAGLSALKTPSCHSTYTSSSSNAGSSTTTVCPICSTELNELARNLPWAHHSKSSVENDPVVLPNGRIYGRERLMQVAAKVGLEAGKVKDPTTGEIFDESSVSKVFIS